MTTPLTDEERRRRWREERGLPPDLPGATPTAVAERPQPLIDQRRAWRIEHGLTPDIAPAPTAALTPEPPLPSSAPAGASPTPAGAPAPNRFRDFLGGIGLGMGVQPLGSEFDLVGQGLSAVTQLSRPALSMTPGLSELGQQVPVPMRPGAGTFERLVAMEQGQPWYSQLFAGVVADPTAAFPGIGWLPPPGPAARAARPVARAAASVPREAVEAAPSTPSTFRVRVTDAESPQGQIMDVPDTPEMRQVAASSPETITILDDTLPEAVPAPPVAQAAEPPPRLPVTEPGAPEAGIQRGMLGVPDREFRPEAPMAQGDLEGLRLQQEGLGAPDSPKPESGVPTPAQSPLEQAQIDLEMAQEELAGARESPGLGKAPRFGTEERRQWEGARMRDSQAGRLPQTKAATVRRAQEKLRVAQYHVREQENLLAARQMIAEDAADAARPYPQEGPNSIETFNQTVVERGAGAPPPISPSGQVMEGGLGDVLAQFRAFLQNPARSTEWHQTLLERSQVLAERSRNVRTRIDTLTEQGLPAEEAINQSRKELAGTLPTVKTPLHQLAAPAVRDALFQEVHLQLANEPLEMVSTAEALANALSGRAIPRTPGTAGGSAYSRLLRVFGDDLTRTLTQRRELEEVIAFQVREGLGLSGPRPAPGPFLSMPNTQTFGSITPGAEQTPLFLSPEEPVLGGLQRPLRPEPPVGPFKELAPDPRPLAQKQLDLQIFKELTGEAAPPTGPLDPRTARMLDIPPDKIVKAPSMLPRNEKNRMLQWGKEGVLTTIDVGNLLKANVATVDLSYPRQQALFLANHPVAFAKSFKDALRALWSKEYAQSIDQWIRNPADQDYQLYVQLQAKHPGRGDFLRPLDGRLAQAWERHEDFIVLGGNRPIQRFARHIPWLNISSRAYITGINSMNWHMFKGHMRVIHRVLEETAAGRTSRIRPGWAGQFMPGALPESFDAIKSVDAYAQMLADMSGRGPLAGPLKEMSPALNAGLFAVRNIIGRLITPRHLFATDKFTRQEAWKNMLTAVGAGTALLMGGHQMGWWDMETDPRSSDYGKALIRTPVGTIRIDVWGGYQQYAVLYARLLPLVGGIKDTATGKVTEYDPVTGTARFMRNKASTLLSDALMLWTGRDFRGQKIDRTDWLFWLKQNSSLNVQSIIEAFQAHGLVGLALAPLSSLGQGVATYDLSLNDIAQQKYNRDYDDLSKETQAWVRQEFKVRQPPEQRKRSEKKTTPHVGAW